jgi:predicted Zn-dependent peptidase
VEYQRTVLANGVRVLSRSAPGAYGARLRLTFVAGAALEPPGAEGLAHLAEHMPFKGAGARDAQAIARAVERRGGEIDAYTDHYETTYLTGLPGPALGEVFAILADMVRRPRLDPADLEKERAVVLEEMRTYEDDPATVAYQAALGGLWHGWPQGRPVAGRPETVARLSLDQVRGWFVDQYRADRLVIAAAGAVEHAELMALVTDHFADLAPVGPAQPPLPRAAADGPWASLHSRESEQVALCLTMPAPAETDPRLPAAEALTMLLGGNDCSRLFARLRDDLGLVYGVDAALEAGPGASQLVLATECAPESIVTVLREIEQVLDQLSATPPAGDELADALAALRARWLLPFDTPTSYADWLAGRELWHGRVESPRAVAARLDAVTPAAVQAMAAECLAPATRHLALVGPLARTWRPAGWRATVHHERHRRGSRRDAR